MRKYFLEIVKMTKYNQITRLLGHSITYIVETYFDFELAKTL